MSKSKFEEFELDKIKPNSLGFYANLFEDTKSLKFALERINRYGNYLYGLRVNTNNFYFADEKMDFEIFDNLASDILGKTKILEIYEKTNKNLGGYFASGLIGYIYTELSKIYRNNNKQIFQYFIDKNIFGIILNYSLENEYTGQIQFFNPDSVKINSCIDFKKYLLNKTNINFQKFKNQNLTYLD